MSWEKMGLGHGGKTLGLSGLRKPRVYVAIYCAQDCTFCFGKETGLENANLFPLQLPTKKKSKEQKDIRNERHLI
ncbi:MAG: hypothetical protein AAGH81_12275 [Bacteroidota bacterium]